MSTDKDQIGDAVVAIIENGSIENTRTWAESNNYDHDTVVGVIKSLNANEIACLENVEKIELRLSDEARGVVNNGSLEVILWESIPVDGKVNKKDLLSAFQGNEKTLSIALGQAMKLKWVTVEKQGEDQFLSRKEKVVKDELRSQLKLLTEGKFDDVTEKDKDQLKKRKMISFVPVRGFKVTKGGSWRSDWKVKPASDLTYEMLQGSSWKQQTFKKYNFEALGQETDGGHIHTLFKVRQFFREIFLELGYEEMPTNNFVESSFWNFDALFQPQSHPARDAHDTFFISDPATTLTIPQDYLDRVKAMHESGGSGSIGWRYKWEESEARKNILRTHTTAVSSRMLYKLAQEPKFTPKKYFSIDKVYRNETLDQTHLAEFHQIEGLVADYNLNLTHLIGAIKQFFERMGIKNLKFKPAYNPYTEPSMEIFGFHPQLNRWVEIGNSGMFRPEMLIPMGLPPDVRVIAWGLSLERPTMIKYAIPNIRDLVGHKVSLDSISKAPIFRGVKANTHQ
eukprot:TRINITY_DN219_c0_g1_i1.p1 TRINITY_DN219_c0_g1~~TRINITY_DN219_c0_g1_i1.p1  ORF type:complete len:509 (-),score=125.57 TRINITY_DN219_c0_g1_i1:120-1646(-)